MLKIGEFSKLSRISIRMLRYYDEMGLLVPETIDSFTGYRYYSEAQLFTAGRITALRDMGFKLCDTAELLKHWEDRETLEQHLLARREEIAVMKMVGASNGFIRGPFVMEGIVQALAGALLAILCISIVRVTVMPKLATMVTFLPLTVDPGVYTMIYLVLVVAGVAVGALGSLLAMRKYLKI